MTVPHNRKQKAKGGGNPAYLVITEQWGGGRMSKLHNQEGAVGERVLTKEQEEQLEVWASGLGPNVMTAEACANARSALNAVKALRQQVETLTAELDKRMAWRLVAANEEFMLRADKAEAALAELRAAFGIGQKAKDALVAAGFSAGQVILDESKADRFRTLYGTEAAQTVRQEIRDEIDRKKAEYVKELGLKPLDPNKRGPGRPKKVSQ